MIDYGKSVIDYMKDVVTSSSVELPSFWVVSFRE